MAMRLLASTLLLCFMYAGQCLAQSLNPCEPVEPKDVQRGKGYVLGLAYWPGGTLENWGNASMGLHPCYDTDNLVKAGVTVASFRVKADTMTVLRTSRRDEAQLYDRRSSGLNLMGKYRSDARYIWSNEAVTTGGVGVVDAQAVVVHFDKGALKTLKWQDMGCVDCNKDMCVVSEEGARACATNLVTECSCSVANNTLAPCQNPDAFPQACHTGIQVATSGTDKNSVAFTSGVQLQKISGLSLTKLYVNSKNQLGSTFEGIKSNATGGVFNQN